MITLLYGVQTLPPRYWPPESPTRPGSSLPKPMPVCCGLWSSRSVFRPAFLPFYSRSHGLAAALGNAKWSLWQALTYRLSTLYYGVTLFLLVPVLWEAVWICFFVLLLGIGNGAYQQVPWSLAADISAETAAKEAVKLEGSFAGFWLLGQKIANAIGPMLFGLLLALAGYSAELVEAGLLQSAEVKQTIRLAMSLLPALLFLASLGLIGQLARRLAP